MKYKVIGKNPIYPDQGDAEITFYVSISRNNACYLHLALELPGTTSWARRNPEIGSKIRNTYSERLINAIFQNSSYSPLIPAEANEIIGGSDELHEWCQKHGK